MFSRVGVGRRSASPYCSATRKIRKTGSEDWKTSVPIPEQELDATRDRYRMQQASGPKRRQIRAQRAREAAEGDQRGGETTVATVPSTSPTHTVGRIAANPPPSLDFDVDQWLGENFRDFGELEDLPAAPKVYIRDQEVQAVASTAYFSQVVDPARRGGPTPPPRGVKFEEIIRAVRDHEAEELTAAEITQRICTARQRRLDCGEVKQLHALVLTAMMARHGVARDLIQVWNAGQAGGQPGLQLACLEWIQTAANREISDYDLQTVEDENLLEELGLPFDTLPEL